MTSSLVLHVRTSTCCYKIHAQCTVLCSEVRLIPSYVTVWSHVSQIRGVCMSAQDFHSREDQLMQLQDTGIPHSSKSSYGVP